MHNQGWSVTVKEKFNTHKGACTLHILRPQNCHIVCPLVTYRNQLISFLTSAFWGTPFPLLVQTSYVHAPRPNLLRIRKEVAAILESRILSRLESSNTSSGRGHAVNLWPISCIDWLLFYQIRGPKSRFVY